MAVDWKKVIEAWYDKKGTELMVESLRDNGKSIFFDYHKTKLLAQTQPGFKGIPIKDVDTIENNATNMMK
ncbi:hypothetical protein M408DRAFT_19976 [Serendipita vermifera MAFF 305830]|uniref:Uncharacterized protein n=1 Tax=Serendipita vermifera MAFF 305830 TaxID=933852 RepID=A0A0C2X2X1_SERVB|nr:hypothetical protein M408DRAFT_19976 [Serendipita vermifera MAFF 305830]